MSSQAPLLLRDELLPKTKIDNFLVRPITNEERELYFGISKLEGGWVNDRYQIASYKHVGKRGIHDASAWMIPSTLLNRSEIFASNYIIEYDEVTSRQNIASDINLLLNILRPTDSLIQIAFSKKLDRSTKFIAGYENNNNQFSAIRISDYDKKHIRNIYKKIQTLSGDREVLFANYMQGLHGRSSLSNRYINLAICLENLFLPGAQHELSYRFALRIAYALGGNKEERMTLFATAKNIYSLRSKIAHGTKLSIEKKDYLKLVDLTWRAINAFFSDKKLFEESSFEKKILSGNM